MVLQALIEVLNLNPEIAVVLQALIEVLNLHLGISEVLQALIEVLNLNLEFEGRLDCEYSDADANDDGGDDGADGDDESDDDEALMNVQRFPLEKLGSAEIYMIGSQNKQSPHPLYRELTTPQKFSEQQEYKIEHSGTWIIFRRC